MDRITTALALIAAIVAAPTAADTRPSSSLDGTLPVTFEVVGLDGRAGVVLCSIFADDRGWPDDDDRALARQVVPVRGDRARCSFDVPPGRYAGAVVHDVNRNHRMDTNLVGIPREGFGFTAGATISTFGAPDFEEARFVVERPTTERIVADYM